MTTEKQRQHDREYYHKNKEHIKARRKKYREANNDKDRLRAEKYYQDNRDHVLERQKTYYQNNKEKIIERSKKYLSSHKNEKRNGDLRRKFGTSLDYYNELYEKQHGLCAICGKKETREGYILAVDHDHVTGKIRGLLCNNCNTGIGLLQDSYDILISASEYIKRHYNSE